MNKGIRNDVREMVLQMLGVDANRLSKATKAEFRAVAHLEPLADDDE